VTVAVNLGKSGLPRNAYCTVFITEVTDQSVGDCIFTFEYTTDNGTTWHAAGAGVIAEAGIKDATALAGRVSFPIGLTDIMPEKHAAASIDWRVRAEIAATVADANDFSFQGYIADHQGYRAPVT